MNKRILRNVLPVLCLLILVITAASCITINTPGPTTGDKTSPGNTQQNSAGSPTIEAFTADPVSLIPGFASTLTWSVKNATSITITPDVGTVSASDAKEVKPTSTTTYTLTATNASGTQSKTVEIKVLTARKTVPDLEVAGLPTIETFSASPASVISGHSSTLMWSVKDATSVMITPDVGTVSATGTKEVKPTSATTYTIVASSASGMRSKAITINISIVGKVEKDFTIVETKKPDLVIQELSVGKYITVSNAAVTRVTIANTGTAFSTKNKAQLLINDNGILWEPIPAIEPGKSWELLFNKTEIPDFVKVTVILDYDKEVDESNENNNSASMIYMP